jgi:elongation factor Ts
MGRIGVLAALESTGNAEKLMALGKQIAMHVAAANPQFLNIAGVDAAALEREKAIYKEQAAASGKPAEIIEKMVQGRVRKYYEEVVLLEQNYIMDDKSKVSQAIEKVANEIGAPIRLIGYLRFGLGEGIQKEEKDFAAEVAAAAGR